MNTVDKVIKIATNEVGYLEKSKTAYMKNPNIIYEKTAGAGQDNYTKYGKEMHEIYPSVMDFPAAWCDAFVDWCFYKAYGVSTAKSLIHGDFNDYTVASATMYSKHNALDNEILVGDQVFFTKNGLKSGCYHTGLVYAVDGNYFYTIEGNTSNASIVVANGGCVAKKKYYIPKYRQKTLFGHPKYDLQNPYKLTSTILCKGNKSESVGWLQWTLVHKFGYDLVIDKDFGNLTEGAVKDLQLKSGLKPDGIVGQLTFAKLKS